MDLAGAAWTIEAVGGTSAAPTNVRGRTFPATVPGCVHSDLIRAAAIGHPDVACHEETCQWIGATDWRYRCRFDMDEALLAHERVDLVLDGLDTVATIVVNGQQAGSAMNMHHAHRFSIKGLLSRGGNDLVIDLRGPVAYVREQEARLGARPVNGGWAPYSYMRKMASNFQWDWGPRVATCGIWRGARLEGWSTARIETVRPIVLRANEREACIDVRISIDNASEPDWDVAEIVLTPLPRQLVSDDPRRHRVIIHANSAEEGGARATLTIPEPALWWPRGFGEQVMYAMNVSILQRGRRVDEHRVDFGLREVRLLREADAHGESFAFEINGVPVFCKGANWIPEGLFPEDQSPQRIRQRLQQAADANMNMLRVWGGGTYEQDAFYDACDELGILVWQDFMFACATYSEDEPYPHLIEREAREAINRLAHHPSIVLWCGGNENVLGYESWGWKQLMPRDQPWGERHFFELLPRVVNELDSSRPYWPDSPHSSNIRAPNLHPNDPDRGDRHTWDAKVEGYRDIVPRFCSEFGHQSPPCWATMRATWGEDQLRVNSRAMVHRQRATGGNDVWYGSKVLGDRFAGPRDFDQWLYLAHLLQARAMSIGIQWLRANRPRCMGALFWQLNDAWAGHSWSCIDSAGRCKPAWFAIRRAFAPRMLTIQPFAGAIRACAVNDQSQPWNATMRVRRMSIDGTVLAEGSVSLAAPASGVWRSDDLAAVVGKVGKLARECIMVETTDERGGMLRDCWFAVTDRHLEYPPCRMTASSVRDGGHVVLTLAAETLVRDAVFAVDRVDPAAEIDDNLLTLLPGESRVLRIRTQADVPAARWITPPVFQCANAFGRESGQGILRG